MLPLRMPSPCPRVAQNFSARTRPGLRLMSPQTKALTLVAQHEAVAADREADLLVEEEGVEVLARVALLLHPGRAAVVGAEDDAAAADDPALLLVDELHAQKRRAHARGHRAPRAAAVLRAQDGAALADRPAALVALEVHVVERGRRARVLHVPRLAAVAREQHAAAAADDPAAAVAVEVEVDQLVAHGHALALPRRAAVLGREHEAVDDVLAAAQAPDDPAALLAREAHAVDLRLGAEGPRVEARRRRPRLAAVLGGEDLRGGEQVAVLLVAEVDVVEGPFGLDRLARPGAPAVARAQDDAAVARRPPALRVEEVDGVQVLPRQPLPPARPAAHLRPRLRRRARPQKNGRARRERGPTTQPF